MVVSTPEAVDDVELGVDVEGLAVALVLVLVAAFVVVAVVWAPSSGPSVDASELLSNTDGSSVRGASAHPGSETAMHESASRIEVRSMTLVVEARGVPGTKHAWFARFAATTGSPVSRGRKGLFHAGADRACSTVRIAWFRILRDATSGPTAHRHQPGPPLAARFREMVYRQVHLYPTRAFAAGRTARP